MNSRSRLAFAALVCAAAAACLGSPAAAGTSADDAPPVEVAAAILGDLPATANAASTYVVTVSSNVDPLVSPGAQWSLEVTDRPLPTQLALDAFLQAPASVPTHRVTSTSAGPDVMGRLNGETAGTTALTVSPGGLGLDPNGTGVYGVIVRLTVAGEVAWEEAAPVTWRPNALPSLEVAALAEIGGQPAEVGAQLAAFADPRIGLLVDPTAMSGTQLAAIASREVWAMPAGGIDLTSIAHADLSGIATSAADLSRASADLPLVGVAAVADQDTVAVASEIGSTATLVTGAWWSVPDTAGAPHASTTLPTGASASLLVANQSITKAVNDPKIGGDIRDALVVARAALAAQSGLTQALVAVQPDKVGAAQTQEAITTLLNASFVQPVDVSSFLAAEPTTVELSQRTELGSDIATADLAAVWSVQQRLTTVAGATTEPSELVHAARLRLLRALELDGRHHPGVRAEQLASALAYAKEIAGAISVTSGSDVVLVSSSGDLPVTVSNRLDVPVTVRLAVSSRSPILAADGQPVATVDANTAATVTVPVSAVSNGDVSVVITLQTEQGASISIADALSVRVRAAWGNAATGIVTAGFALLLLAGIVRTIRRGRRDTRLRPDDSTVVAGDDVRSAGEAAKP